MNAWQEHQEHTIQRARRVAPDDPTLIEAGSTEERDESYIVACEILDEAL